MRFELRSWRISVKLMAEPGRVVVWETGRSNLEKRRPFQEKGTSGMSKRPGEEMSLVCSRKECSLRVMIKKENNTS